MSEFSINLADRFKKAEEVLPLLRQDLTDATNAWPLSFAQNAPHETQQSLFELLQCARDSYNAGREYMQALQVLDIYLEPASTNNARKTDINKAKTLFDGNGGVRALCATSSESHSEIPCKQQQALESIFSVNIRAFMAVHNIPTVGDVINAMIGRLHQWPPARQTHMKVETFEDKGRMVVHQLRVPRISCSTLDVLKESDAHVTRQSLAVFMARKSPRAADMNFPLPLSAFCSANSKLGNAKFDIPRDDGKPKQSVLYLIYHHDKRREDEDPCDDVVRETKDMCATTPASDSSLSGIGPSILRNLAATTHSRRRTLKNLWRFWGEDLGPCWFSQWEQIMAMQVEGAIAVEAE
ncbi:hypothetical protein PspLS_09925 [Pyricularia sp. CBS 133598]|nr:hypothetical protein PspLS_09925 [Pyricularia sp. CBS 133598]